MAVRYPASGGHNVTLTLGSQTNYTFACWANIITDRNTFSTAWSFDANMDGSMVALQTDSDGTTMKVYDDAVGNFVATGPSMTVGTWYYLCVAVAGTSATLYWRAANTQTMSSANWTGAARTITRVLIGDDRYSEPLNGRVAAFTFWQAGLTAAEVANESQRQSPVRLANLRTFYPFVRTETTDYSGNGHTLTGGAGTTTEDGPPTAWLPASPRLIVPPSAGGTTFPLSVSGSVTPTAAVVRQPQKPVAGTTTPTGATTKQPRRILAGAATPAGAVLKRLSRALGGSTTPVGAVATVRTRLLALAGAVTPTGLIARQVAKQTTGSTTPAGTPTKQAAKSMAGAATPAGVLSSIRTRLVALAGAITPAGTLARQAAKSTAGSVTPTGAAVKSTARRLLGAITPTGALSSTRTKLLAVVGAIAPAGLLVRRVGKALAGSATPTGGVTKRASRTMSGLVSPAGALLKLVGRLLGGTTAPSGSVATLLGSPPEDAGTFESGQRPRSIWNAEGDPGTAWGSRHEVRSTWEVDQ